MRKASFRLPEGHCEGDNIPISTKNTDTLRLTKRQPATHSPYISALPQRHTLPSMHAGRHPDAAKTAVCELDLAKNIVFKSYFNQKHVFFKKQRYFSR